MKKAFNTVLSLLLVVLEFTQFWHNAQKRMAKCCTPHLHFSFAVMQDDFLVSKPVKQHLAKYDKQLKKFNVSKALDTALEVWQRK